MAFFDEDYDVRMAEGYVRQAEAQLASCKFSRDQAKANGNYKNSSKNIRLPNGSMGNGYDSNVYSAQELLKKRKAELAKAKERAREAKKRKQEEAKKKATSSSSSSSTRSSSSSSSSSTRSSSSSCSSRGSSSSSTDFEWALKVNELVNSYRTTLEGKYKIDNASDVDLLMCIDELRDESNRWKKESNVVGCDEFKKIVFLEWKSVADSFCYRASKRLKDLYLERYVKSLDKRFPIENASAEDLAKMLPVLVGEIAVQDGECKKNVSDVTLCLIYNAYKQAVMDVARKACLLLKKQDRTLFEKTDVQQSVKKIDPRLESSFVNKTKDTLLAPYLWFEDKKNVATKWFDDKKAAVTKWFDDKKAAITKWFDDKKTAVTKWLNSLLPH